MKILHTSDWHLGRMLCGKKRYEEFDAFLSWLADTIDANNIDALLVAGDVFDTCAPGARAQEQYYRFLCRVAQSACRHVVITAGNHDSASFLNAPRELLRALNVYVIGNITAAPEDEILVLCDGKGEPELIACAVPYLRDRDVRRVLDGESVEDKEMQLIDGIRGHYAQIAEMAEKKRAEFGKTVPVAAMGHLFAAGAQTVAGDGVRELYVGSLAHVSAGIFPPVFDYVALGHLHVPQTVAGMDNIRYSGSPLAMSFGEAQQRKTVCVIEFDNSGVAVNTIEIPKFRELRQLRGNLEAITGGLHELKKTGEPVWVEVIYSGDEVLGDLKEQLDEMTSGTLLEILRIKDARLAEAALTQEYSGQQLDELDEKDVFTKCLDFHEVVAEQRPALIDAYNEILHALRENDSLAE